MVPLELHGTLRKTNRISWAIINKCQEPICQHAGFPLAFFSMISPVVRKFVFDNWHALINDFPVHFQKLGQRRCEIEILVQPDDIASHLNTPRILKLDIETTSKTQAFPNQVTAAFYTQDGMFIMNRSHGTISLAPAPTWIWSDRLSEI